MAASDHLQGQLFTEHGRPETKQPAPEPEPPKGKLDPHGQIPGQIGLMTAQEITSRYVPNEPDRQYHGTDISVRRASGVRLPGPPDPRAGEATTRTSRTDGVVNNMWADPKDPAKPFTRSSLPLAGGEMAKPETDEQLYARKLGEAQKSPSRKGPGGRGVITEPSLEGRIKSEGVQTPIALGHEEDTGRPPFVAGGHHRLAVMQHLNSNQLLPVAIVSGVGAAHDMESEAHRASQPKRARVGTKEIMDLM